MKSNYKPIGDYIRLVDQRNIGLKVTTLLGLSIAKEFIPSVANTIGSDMENYKIIRRNQFACSLMQVRRDKKIPIALLHQFDEAIISQAYPVFEVIDANIIRPEYLMMWFSRAEFDREACFYAVGGVRGSLEWEDFCNMKLPVPSIEKQKEIVEEYNIIVNRIKLNEQLNLKLEETAQTIYKQWFVDFEFPDENGKPYKSSGGEMVWNEELGQEIPKGWGTTVFGELMDTINGYAFNSCDFVNKGVIPILKIKNIKPPSVELDRIYFYGNQVSVRLEKVVIKKGDILISMTGSGINQLNSAVGQVGRYHFDCISLLNQRVCKLAPKTLYVKEYAYQIISKQDTHMELLNGSTGSANQANISPDQILALKVLKPTRTLLEAFDSLASKLDNIKRFRQQPILLNLKEIVLSKMSIQISSLIGI